MAAEIIGYLRVSTAKQGESGLGMEGQRTAVEEFARQNGSRVAGWYTEVESGKRADRPELARALGHAKRSKATLVVAKLDRLARNVRFLATVMDSGANFVACDNPQANRLTLHILAAVAEAGTGPIPPTDRLTTPPWPSGPSTPVPTAKRLSTIRCGLTGTKSPPEPEK